VWRNPGQGGFGKKNKKKNIKNCNKYCFCVFGKKMKKRISSSVFFSKKEKGFFFRVPEFKEKEKNVFVLSPSFLKRNSKTKKKRFASCIPRQETKEISDQCRQQSVMFA